MRHLSRTFAAVAGLTLVMAPVSGLAESIVEANVRMVEFGDTVAVARIPDGPYLRTTNDPDDIIWERLPEYRIHVMPAPPVHESVDLRVNYEDEGHDLFFTPARTEDRFYMRLRWRDPTKDVRTLRDAFRDGVAVQFSLGDDYTSYMMGTGPEEPVNIWYWRSDEEKAYSLAAGGPGSTTILEDQPVSGAAMYVTKERPEENEWVVVMSRPIEVEGEYQADLDRNALPVAFAVWQGAEEQRDGLKSVSADWILMDVAEE